MSETGRRLVDSYGGERVVQAIKGKHFLYMREATMDDSRLIWTWANDPDTRSASFSTAAIPWEAHSEWYSEKLTDPQHRMWIAIDDTLKPVGQIRYQIDGRQATVSVNLAPDQRGQGYGSRILEIANTRLFAGGDVDTIHAYIKPDNHASKYTFQKAGFVLQEVTRMEPGLAEHYALEAAQTRALHQPIGNNGQIQSGVFDG
jgi:RimJ/RimL family protein N-acetyltransferase